MCAREPVTETSRVCASCGTMASSGARYCSNCGLALDGTAAPRHVYGVLAPGPTFVLGCILLAGGVVAFIVGSLVVGIVLVVLSAVTFVLFHGAAERDPTNPIARATTTSARSLRDRFVFGREFVQAWARAAFDIVTLHLETRRLASERRRLVLAFGDASYREDQEATTAVRAQLAGIDARLADCARERALTLANAKRHVSEERVAVQPTQRLSLDELTSREGDT